MTLLNRNYIEATIDTERLRRTHKPGAEKMATKEMKRVDANAELTAAIAAAIKAAHEAGLSADDVRAALDRFSELLNEE